MEKLHQKIKRLRLERKLNQTEVAEMAGITRATYVFIENGKTKNISIDVGKGIAKALEIPFDELFEIDGAGANLEEQENLIKVLQDSEKDLEKQLAVLETTIDLLQKKISAYKKFIFISLQTYTQPFISKIDEEISTAETDIEKQSLEERKASFYKNIDSLLSLYVDLGLITEDEIKKFKNEGNDISLSFLK